MVLHHGGVLLGSSQLLELLGVDGLLKGGVQNFLHLIGGVLGHTETAPGSDVHIIAQLLQGGNVGVELAALTGADGQDLQLARGHAGGNLRLGHRDHLHMAAHQVGHRGGGAVEGHHVHIDVSGLGKGVAGDVPDRTGAGGAHLQLAGMLLAPVDQIFNGVPLRIGADGDGGRLNVAAVDHVEGRGLDLLGQALGLDHGQLTGQIANGIAVRGGVLHIGHGHHTGAAHLVLGHYGDAQLFLHHLGDEAGVGVGQAACRGVNDHVDGLAGGEITPLSGAAGGRTGAGRARGSVTAAGGQQSGLHGSAQSSCEQSFPVFHRKILLQSSH